MELTVLIDDYVNYVKNNGKFRLYREKVEQLINDNKLEEIALKNIRDIYQGGKDGKSSFIRRICSEVLMGTHFGPIFSSVSSFFYKKDKEKDKVEVKVQNFNTFISFIQDLASFESKSYKSDQEFYSEFENCMIKEKYFEKLSSLWTVIIQILSCYFDEYFLPVYQIDKKFFRYMEIEDTVKIQNNNFLDLIRFNKKLMSEKRKYKGLQELNNIEYTHFLFLCFPRKDDLLKKVRDLGFKFINNTEQFVVTLFSKIHIDLGFPYFTRIQEPYPDAEILDEKGKAYQVEFEYLSSGFAGHLIWDKKTKEYKHPDLKCDMIICWEDDIPEKSKLRTFLEGNKEIKTKVDIISLKEELKKLNLKGSDDKK